MKSMREPADIICIVGVFAFSDARNRFAGRINSYFAAWRNALAGAIQRMGKREKAAENVIEFSAG
jgi:TetR/AcrR family transcriptional repressor of lmrAB and yxaGH operons